MVCTLCGDHGHNARTCTTVPHDEDAAKRGPRTSPRTPSAEDKLAKLRKLSQNLSPKMDMPPLPHLDASGSAGMGVHLGAEAVGDDHPEAKVEPQTSEQKLDKIMEMMGKVVVKEDLNIMKESLLKEVTAKTKVAISEAVDPVKSELRELRSRVGVLEAAPTSDGPFAQRIVDIEKAIAELKIAPVPGSKDQSTAMVGGLQGVSSADAAKSWLSEAVSRANIEGVIDIYDKCKGGDFNGLLFVKFNSAEMRDAAMIKFNAKKNAFDQAPMFMNRDLPIQQRTKFSFLLNLKKLLVNWGFENVRFDDGPGTLMVGGGAPVLQVKSDGFNFRLEWLDDKWGQWVELTSDPSFKLLIKTAEEKLSTASKSKGKGKTSPG